MPLTYRRERINRLYIYIEKNTINKRVKSNDNKHGDNENESYAVFRPLLTHIFRDLLNVNI